MTNSLLWKIEKDNVKTSYLFGTIHVYDARVFQIPEIIYELINYTDIYAPETDNRNVSYYDLMEYITVKEPDYNLKNYLNEESYNKILEMSNIEPEILDKYKPFFVSSFILASDDMPSSSIDSELLGYAFITDKTICEIESFEEQINAVDKIPFEEQADIIEKSLSSLDKKNDFTKIMTSYKNQNLDELKNSLGEMAPTQIFIDSIQKDRNITMANKIDAIITGGYSVFAAVGALHIPDTTEAKGIVSLLKNKGYIVEPVSFLFNQNPQ